MTTAFCESLLGSLQAHELSFFYTQISELSFEHWLILNDTDFRFVADTNLRAG
jgi:hypothetical protein